MFLFGRKKANVAVTEEQARFDGRLLTYVTKRVTEPDGNTTEITVGKSGRLCAVGTAISIICGEKTIFSGHAEDTNLGELMSRNGVIVSGKNQLTGEQETLVAHFSNYR